MKKLKSQKGITLIALIITIVVLLIIAGVAIGTLQESNIIGQAQNAAGKYNSAKKNEVDVLDNYEGILKKYENSEEDFESCVGKYADIDGDGTIDGIIYADLAIGGSGQWINSDGSYVVGKEENLKEYGITKIDGEDVVVEKENTIGNDRFYVMALDIVKAEVEDRVLFILLNLPSEGETFISTQTEFGTGKSNTEIMKASNFVPTGLGQNLLWETIESDLNNRWFIPSRGELAAYADRIGFNIPFGYWTSSVNQNGTGWLVSSGGVGADDTNKQGLILLSTTF